MKTFIRILSWVIAVLTISALSAKLFGDYSMYLHLAYCFSTCFLYGALEKQIFDKLFKENE